LKIDAHVRDVTMRHSFSSTIFIVFTMDGFHIGLNFLGT